MERLNDLAAIEKLDTKGMFCATYSMPDHIRDAMGLLDELSLSIEKENIQNIVIAGMGGSAIGGNLLRVYSLDRVNIPIIISRSYALPCFVSEKTLVIVSSYSGNTEETLSAYEAAKNKRAKIVSICTGGKLRELSIHDGYPVITIRKGLSPRAAIAYSFIPLVMLFSKIGLLPDLKEEMQESIELLEKIREEYKPEIPFENNLAKKVAYRFFGKLPVIYGSSGITEVIAERWKGQISENSKAPAYFNCFPELNHNEIVGTDYPKDLLKQFEIVILKDLEDHPRNRMRMEITKNLIKEVVSGVLEIESMGNSRMARMFSLIMLGDYASEYLAVLYGVDPTPVEKINLLKDELAKLREGF